MATHLCDSLGVELFDNKAFEISNMEAAQIERHDAWFTAANTYRILAHIDCCHHVIAIDGDLETLDLFILR